MIRIAICDDEPAQHKYLQELIDIWGKKNGHIVSVRTFDSAEAFLFTYSEDKSFDILLLDIKMKSMDGVALAREIRKDNDTLQIIFITGFTDYILEGYEVSALHYLTKPVNERKLLETLDRALARLQAPFRMLLFQKSSGNIRIPADDIYFAEAFSHHVTLHTKDEQLEFNMRLADMEKKLGDGFFRCHRSYIVGMKHVRKVTRTAIVLESGISIPLSRALYDKTNQIFIQSC